LLFVTVLVFGALKAVPGGPFDGEQALAPELKAALEARFGLDQPWPLQLAHYLAGLARGDLGASLRSGGVRPVAEIIADGLPQSAALGAVSLALALVCGIFLGAIAAARKGTALDGGIRAILALSMAVPSYVIAAILVFLFALHWQLLPPALWDGPTSLILPILTLTARPVALVGRLMRTAFIEAMAAPHMGAARARGIPETVLLFRHGLKVALVPLTGLLGPLAASLLTGSFVVEAVFALPGLGRHFVSSVLDRDHTVILGITLLYGVGLVCCNLLSDLLAAALDPRVRP
jgi:oligopeptide transport system permease protein